ncbi:MAG: hypothetical protein HPY73_05725 [Methanomassiliicoccales archaeon]|nr:MAG: hypothetical protein HPY73_05725 [Methanomassiliicoccales archaeon]
MDFIAIAQWMWGFMIIMLLPLINLLMAVIFIPKIIEASGATLERFMDKALGFFGRK